MTRRAVVLLVVASLATALSSCALLDQGRRPPTRVALLQAAHLTETVGVLTSALVDQELAFYRGGRIPEDRHRVFLATARTFATGALDALAVAADQARPESERLAALVAAIRLADWLLAHAIAPIPDPDVRRTLDASVVAIRSVLALVAT